MDLNMPIMDGASAAKEIKKLYIEGNIDLKNT
jgi:CheY-like chemotaxis protein